MTGIEFWVWVILGGYILSRWRLHKWQQTKKAQRHDTSRFL